MGKAVRELRYEYSYGSTTDIEGDLRSAKVRTARNRVHIAEFTVYNPSGQYSEFGNTGKKLDYSHVMRLRLDYGTITGSSPVRFEGTLLEKECGDVGELVLRCASYEHGLSQRRVPCWHRYQSGKSIEEILIGTRGSADAYGWKDDAVLKGAEIRVNGLEVPIRKGTIDSDANTQLELGIVEFDKGSTLLEVLQQLADIIGYTFKLRRVSNLVYLDFEDRTGGSTWTVSRGATFGTTTRAIHENRVRRTEFERFDAIEVFGQPAYSVYAKAGGDPASVARVKTVMESGFTRQNEAELLADYLWAELGVERFEGTVLMEGCGIYVDDVVSLTDDYYDMLNESLKVQEIVDTWNDRGWLCSVVVDKRPWSFSDELSSTRRIVEVMRTFTVQLTDWDCLVPILETVSMDDSGSKIYRNGTAANDFLDGTEVASW